MSSFAPLKYASKKQISSDKASKMYYMRDMHLQLPVLIYLWSSLQVGKPFYTKQTNFAISQTFSTYITLQRFDF